MQYPVVPASDAWGILKEWKEAFNQLQKIPLTLKFPVNFKVKKFAKL